jgi:hypothetical protein
MFSIFAGAGVVRGAGEATGPLHNHNRQQSMPTERSEER